MGKKYDGSLIYDTSLNLAGFKKGLANLKTLAKSGAITVGAVTTAIGALETAGIRYNARIEDYQTSFKVMTGSAEKAAETIKTLKKIGATTPFELTDLAETTQLLMNYNFTADEAIDRMSMLGDISQGNADKLNRIAMAYGQMSSANKVALEDVKQMIEAGFNPLQEISKTTGESMASLYDRISKGAISVNEITASMQRSTSEGGKYFQSMAEQSKGVNGQLSTMRDNWDSFTGAVAKSASKELKDSVLPEINEALEKSIQMVEGGALDEIDGVVSKIASFVAHTIPKAVDGLSTILDNLNLIKSVAVGIGVGAIIYAIAPAAIAATKTIVSLAGSVNILTMSLTAAIAKQAALKALFSTTGAIGLSSAIIGLTATFISWQRSIDTTDNALRNLRKEHVSNLKVIEDNYNAQIAETKQVELLADKIIKLGREYDSYAKDSAQAKAKSEEFKSVAEELETLIPGVTSVLYNETGEINIQADAVSELTSKYIELAKAKAMAEALSDKMKETASRIVDVQEKYDKLNYSDGEDSISADSRSWGEKFVGRWRANNVLAQSRKLKNELTLLQNEWEGYATKASEVNELVQTLTGNTTKNETPPETSIHRTLSDVKSKTKEIKEQAEILKEQREKELRDLKHQLQMQELSHEEYYKKLTQYRDKYFEEGSDEWQQFTEEIYDFNKSACDNYVDTLEKSYNEASDIIDSLKKKQKSLADNLYSDANLGMSKITIKSGQGTEEYFQIADVESQNKQLEEYSRLLDELFAKRGELPEEALKQLSSMSVEDGANFARVMLNMSGKEWDAYVSSLLNREDIAGKIGSQLMTSEFEEAKKILEDKFGQVPEDFFGIGTESAEYFGEGFVQKLNAIIQSVRNTVMAEMNSMVPAAVAFSGVGASATGNTYTNSYNFYSSKDTTTQQLKAAVNASTLSRLRGGN